MDRLMPSWLNAAFANRFGPFGLAFALLGPFIATSLLIMTMTVSAQTIVPRDDELAKSLPGNFVSATKEVNGVRLHYVVGGQGRPLFLLPGWPQTWWQFRKIMPELAKNRRVIAVDIRGMGGSSKPRDGYYKKTMAADISALATALGFEQIDIAGHDIGAMVAYAFAANHPRQTGKIALIDVAHPDESLNDLTLLPPAGQPAVGSGEATHPVYLWWFALNQIPDLPEALLAGRIRLLIDWLFDTQLKDRNAISQSARDLLPSAMTAWRAGGSPGLPCRAPSASFAPLREGGA
jgi:pimeloyl-ACP methyl ester carboxylesterase